MRVFYIANVRFPSERAHSVQIAKMADALASRFSPEALTLIVPLRLNRGVQGSVKDFFLLKNDISTLELPVIDLMPLLPFALGFAFWIETVTFTLSLGFYLLFLKLRLSKISWKKKATYDLRLTTYDLKIFCRDEFPALIASFLFPKKIIFDMHQFFPRLTKLYRFLDRREVRFCVLTKSLEAKLRDCGVHGDVRIVPDAVVIEDFQKNSFPIRNWKLGNVLLSQENSELRHTLSELYGIPKDASLVVCNGSLKKWKGVYVLAEASRFLQDNIFIVNVGGTASERETFLDFLKKEGLSRVVSIPPVPYREIPRYLGCADVVTLPNIARSGNEYENALADAYTSPLKLFEYMAARKPIVATKTRANLEILDEETAVLVEPDSPKALAEGIIRVLNDTVLRDRIVENAYQNVQEYTWEKRVAKMVNATIGLRGGGN